MNNLSVYNKYVEVDEHGINIAWNNIAQFGSFPLLVSVGAYLYFVHISPISATSSLSTTGIDVYNISNKRDCSFGLSKEGSTGVRLKISLGSNLGTNVTIIRLRPIGSLMYIASHKD